jgi:hypothetical protein
LPELFSCCTGGLNRGSLGQKYGLRIVQPEARDGLVGPACFLPKLLKGTRERLCDERVEKWAASECTEGVAFFGEQRPGQYWLVKVVPGGDAASGLSKQELLRGCG